MIAFVNNMILPMYEEEPLLPDGLKRSGDVISYNGNCKIGMLALSDRAVKTLALAVGSRHASVYEANSYA
jgi:hypothetical protein